MIAHPPRAAGGFIGACLAVALVVLALPSGGHGTALPASLEVSVQGGDAIAATPPAPNVLVQTAGLRPGGEAAAAGFELVNEAGRVATVGLRAVPSTADLDQLVRIEIEANGVTLADSTLADLRGGSPGSVVLGSGESRHLRVVASIPAGAQSGFEGRRVAVVLVPVARTEAGR